MNPMLKSIVNPNKAPSETQKRYPSKFNPRASSVSCPIGVFDELNYTKQWEKQSRRSKIKFNCKRNTIYYGYLEKWQTCGSQWHPFMKSLLIRRGSCLPFAIVEQGIHLERGQSHHRLVDKPKTPTLTNLAYSLQCNKTTSKLVPFLLNHSTINRWDEKIWESWPLGIIKPQNRKLNNSDNIPATDDKTRVRETEAKKRNMDIDVKWTANNIMKCRKNLRNIIILLEIPQLS